VSFVHLGFFGFFGSLPLGKRYNKRRPVITDNIVWKNKNNLNFLDIQ